MYKSFKDTLTKAHGFLVFPRRTKILSSLIASLLPKSGQILDIGCGDGTIDKKIMSLRSDVRITGLDILKRERSAITVRVFDGKIIPAADNSYDAVLLIDTLHHAPNSKSLLKEAKRVTKKYVIIKDHYLQGKTSMAILRLMDWIGNKAYNVNLPYNYYSYKEWEKLFKELGLRKEKEISNLGLYPFPFSLLFDRNYHFLAKFEK